MKTILVSRCKQINMRVSKMVRHDFALWIEAQRKERGWSRRELGRRAGVSGTHIGKIEQDLTGVSAPLCERLAVAFNADPVEVLKLAGLVGRGIPNEPLSLTEAEVKILEDIRAMSISDRESLADFARYLKERREGQRVSPKKEKALA